MKGECSYPSNQFLCMLHSQTVHLTGAIYKPLNYTIVLRIGFEVHTELACGLTQVVQFNGAVHKNSHSMLFLY